jgi:hypothetical protein
MKRRLLPPCKGCAVSGDKKHLLALRKFQGIPIVSPAELMRRLAASA